MFITKRHMIIPIAVLGLAINTLATQLVFKSGDCNYNREVFSNFTLDITNGKLRMEMTLIKMLTTGLKGHLSFEFRMSKAKQYQSLFQHDINYCMLLKGSQDSIYRRWFLTMLKVGNFATSCPIKPGRYYLNGWHLDGKLVPSFFYLGDYKIAGTFYYGKYRRTDKPMLECTVEAILV